MTLQCGRPLACLALLAATTAWGADPPSRSDKDVRALAGKIDKHLAAAWEKVGLKPAPPASDAEFLRRVTLDLAGRIPSVAELRAFLRDKDPNKRKKAVERLLKSPRHVSHFTNVFRSWMLPEASASFQARFLVPGFEAWVRGQLSDNVPYDKMVRDLLTAPVGPQQGQFGFAGGQASNPSAFYIAKEVKAENVAASAARLFLGVRLECAQCHDHPFAKWEKQQFWQFAAFFSGMRRQNQGDFAVPGQETANRREIAIPGTGRTIKAKFLDGSEPKWKDKESTRKTLADWITAPANPYFARATVNRMWQYFFGNGLVEPVDEMIGTDSKPSHPELLDELAKEFAAHQFDLKFLMRALTASRAYQLSSIRTAAGQDDPKLFACMPLRGLTAEQIYDSVVQATGFKEGNLVLAQPVVLSPFGGGSREDFVNKFSEQNGKATDFQSSILQALVLMNGKLIESATSLENSETLLAVVDNPFMNTQERIETLYLAALSRPPRAKELTRMVKFVEAAAGEEGGEEATEEQRERRYKQGLADVFWALLNSGEFLLNH
jgi:hypothetical protein